MATAVLHPQDYLQNDRNCPVFCMSDYPSPFVRPSGRGFPATHEPSISPATELDAAEGSGSPSGGGYGLLIRRGSSPGLLPLPDQALQYSHNTCSRLAPDVAVSRFGESAVSYGNKRFISSRRPNFSSYVSEMCIDRRPSVPLLDRATHAQRFLSDCFPLHGVQLDERKPLWHDARYFFDSAQGNCTSDPLPYSNGNVISCQKLKFVANSRFSDTLNPVHLKRADSFDQSIHYRKRMHPELRQPEVYSGRQCGKPPLKVLPDAQAKSICTKISTVGRKSSVNKHLKRSASEKLQERSETPILPRSGTKEATRKLSEGVTGSLSPVCSRSKIEEELTPPASEGISTSCSSELDKDDMWASMMNYERWAGPSFINSPSPSALPVPSFPFLFSRAVSEPARAADCGAHRVACESSPKAKQTRDVTFATNDLRRMLHLDHTSRGL